MNPNLYQLADPESHKISNLPHKFIPLLFDPIIEIIEAYHIDQCRSMITWINHIDDQNSPPAFPKYVANKDALGADKASSLAAKESRFTAMLLGSRAPTLLS